MLDNKDAMKIRETCQYQLPVLHVKHHFPHCSAQNTEEGQGMNTNNVNSESILTGPT
jgi:hypothetical protein